VNLPNGLRLGEGQHVDAVFQVTLVILKWFSPKARLVETKGVHHGPHGTVKNGDSL
jgi:hypothetical protein